MKTKACNHNQSLNNRVHRLYQCQLNGLITIRSKKVATILRKSVRCL